MNADERELSIEAILRHPDYLRFAEEVTACGRQVCPGKFPWRFMGLSDAEIETADLRFDHGTPIRPDLRDVLKSLVRFHERLVIEHWQWWLSNQCKGVPNGAANGT
ncbi:MAG: hypothetical protein ABFE13_01445 [Phycisphaerales bacterium]